MAAKTDGERTSHRLGDGIDRDQLEQWVESGYTDSDIAQLIAELLNTTPPTRQAVAYHRRRLGIQTRYARAEQLDHSDVLPWRVRRDHSGHMVQTRLYDYSRRLKGRRLSPSAERRVDEFVKFLNDNSLVVSYDANSPEGWLFVPRDAAVDRPDEIIRRPQAKRHAEKSLCTV